MAPMASKLSITVAAALGSAYALDISDVQDTTLVVAPMTAFEVVDYSADTEGSACVAPEGEDKVHAFSNSGVTTATLSADGTGLDGAVAKTDKGTDWAAEDGYKMALNKKCVNADGKVYALLNDPQSLASNVVSWDPATKDTDNQWQTVGSDTAAVFETAVAAGNKKLYRFGGSPTKTEDADQGAAALPDFKVMDTEAASPVWTTADGTVPSNLAGHGRSAVMAYDTDRDMVYVIAGFKPTYDSSLNSGAGGNTWAALDEMYPYNAITGTWGTSVEVPTGCDLSAQNDYEKRNFHRQLTYVSEIRSLVLTLTCEGENTKMYIYDVDMPAAYRQWRKKGDLGVTALKLYEGSTVLSQGKALVIANGQNNKLKAQTVLFGDNLEFCQNGASEIDDQVAAYIVDGTTPTPQLTECELKRLTPAQFTVGNSGTHTLSIKIKIPKALRTAEFSYKMDAQRQALDSTTSLATPSAENCINQFVAQATPGSWTQDYHDEDGFLEFQVADISSMWTECGLDGAEIWSDANDNSFEAEHLLRTLGAKFRLFAFIAGSASAEPAVKTTFQTAAHMVKQFEAQVIYDTKAQGVVSATLYNNDMGTLTATNKGQFDVSSEVKEKTCTSEVRNVLPEGGVCVETTVTSDVMDLTGRKWETERIRIVRGADLQEKFDTHDGELKDVDGTDAWDKAQPADMVATACSSGSCTTQSMFQIPSLALLQSKGIATCFDCKLILNLKNVASARRLGDNEAQRQQVMVDLPLRSGKGGSNVKASSAVRPAAAVVATAAAAGAALLA